MSIAVQHPETLSSEALELYFENKRRSGGGEMTNCVRKSGLSIFTFKDAIDAKNVEERRHSLQGHSLTVFLVEKHVVDPRVIEVHGKMDLTLDVLEMYFESPRASSGGEIETAFEDNNVVTIKFIQSDVAERVFRKPIHILNKVELRVKRPKPGEYRLVDYERMVEARVSPGHCTSDTVEMYFENTRRSGGGNIQRMHYNDTFNIYTLTFETTEVANRVLSRKHKINENTINVYRPSILKQKRTGTPQVNEPEVNDDNANPHDEIIEVMNGEKKSLKVFNLDLPIDLIKLYFENKQRSGGGKISSILKDVKRKFYIIDFEKTGVSERVAEQKIHQLGTTTISVEVDDRPVDRCRILLCNLTKMISCKTLHVYLQLVTGVEEIPEIKFGKCQSMVMVTFKGALKDYETTLSKIKETPLEGIEIEPKQVLEADTIVVKQLDEKFTEDIVRLYFENKNNGGLITEFQLDKEDQSALICFQNYQVVKAVNTKEHIVLDSRLVVKPYYDGIGELLFDNWRPQPVIMEVPSDIQMLALADDEIKNLAAKGMKLDLCPEHPGTVRIDSVDGFNYQDIVDWQAHASRFFNEFLTDTYDKLVLEAGEHLHEFLTHLKNEYDSSQIIITSDDSLSVVEMLGKKRYIEKISEEVKEYLQSMIEKAARKCMITNKSVPLTQLELKLTHLLDFETFAVENFDLTINIHESNNEVIFVGTVENISKGVLSLREQLDSLPKNTLTLNNEICSFLSEKSDVLEKIMQDNGKNVVYEIQGNTITIFCVNQKDILVVEDFLKNQLKTSNYHLKKESEIQYFRSSQSRKFLAENNCDKVKTSVDESRGLLVTGFKDSVEEVLKKVTEVLERNTIHEKNLKLTSVAFSFIERNCPNLEKVEIYSIGNNTIRIRGKKEGNVDKAVNVMENFLTKIRHFQYPIGKLGMKDFFAEEKGKKALCSIENDCNCCIRIDQPEQIVEELFKCRLKSGQLLVACKVDLTQLNVDAIVNTANKKLKHESGLAGAIINEGGDEIQLECSNIMRERGIQLMKPGQALTTSAGKLPCKYVIHTVGPKFDPSQLAEVKQLLTAAVTCALQEADGHQCQTIGIPAISSGASGFPPKLCAEIIVQATINYLDANSSSHINEIFFSGNQDSICQAFIDEVKNTSEIKYNFDSADGYRPRQQIQVISKNQLKTKEGLTVELNTGSIAEICADVLVNTTAEDLNLSSGAVSKAMLKKAGNDLQEQCNKIISSRGKVSIGDFVETGGGSLNCSQVYHAVCGLYHGNQSENNLRVLLSKMFNSAAGFNSIAVPALGTGNLKYPADVVAKIMYEEALEFSSKSPSAKLKRIIFVVYHADKTSLQAFQKIQDSMGNMAELKINPHRKDDVMKISDKSAIIPAKVTKSNIQTKEGLEVKLIKGNIATVNVDVIVNTTTVDLNLSTGAVSKAILKEAGDDLQKLCTQIITTKGKVSVGDFVQTEPCSLKCSKVYHAVCEAYSGYTSEKNLKVLLSKMFNSAAGFNSIAVPALGTGNLKYPADVAAKIMYEEAIEFSAKNPSAKLKTIQFVVYQGDKTTLQAFEEMHNPDMWTPVKDKSGTEEEVEPFSYKYKNFYMKKAQYARIEFRNVHIYAENRDIVNDTSDAIVCFHNKSFGSSFGSSSQHIMDAKDDSHEFKKHNDIGGKSYFHTSGSGLVCQYIIHVRIMGFVSDLEKSLTDVLLYAKSNGWNTVAIPDLGAESTMCHLLKIVPTFAQQVTEHLILAKVLTAQEKTLESYAHEMKNYEGKIVMEKKNPIKKAMSKVFPSKFRHDLPSIMEECVILSIHANDRGCFEKVKEKIKKVIEDETIRMPIRVDNTLCELFDDDKLCKLRSLGSKSQVQVKFDLRTTDPTIVLEGRPGQVTEVTKEVQLVIQELKKQEREFNEYESIIGEVKWYRQENERLIIFDDDSVITLEKNFRKNIKRFKMGKGQQSLEVDLEKSSAIRPSQEEIQIVRWEVKELNRLPNFWEPMKAGTILSVPLDTGSKEYLDLDAKFKQTVVKEYKLQARIQIFRIQNLELWKQYAAKKESFQTSMPGIKIEKLLYHGTSKETVEPIKRTGFNRSYAGKNAAKYGNGTYFAAEAYYSSRNTYSPPDSDGFKYVYLSRVLVGEYTLGKEGMVAPPNKPNSVDLYNSVVNDVKDPFIFVIFNDVQALPAYLIKFK